MSSIKVKMNKRLERELASLGTESESGIRFVKDKDDRYKIDIYMSEFPNDTKIYKDLKQFKIKEVHFEVTIPEKYPFKPPFVRIVEPRFKGYKGFVTTGGSLCLDIITPNAWSPAYSIDKLFVQIREFVKNAEIDPDNYKVKYTKEEAEKHFESTTRIHNWGKRGT